jgi:hypothetical protein
MNALKKIVFLGLMLVFCFFQSCKKNGDPCPAEVDFEMSQGLIYYENFDVSSKVVYKAPADTIKNGYSVDFEASDCGAEEFEWLIGGETEVRTGKKINVEFEIENLSNPIVLNIKLTAKFNNVNNCRNYPNNQKVIIKKICIMPELQVACLGKFEGYDTLFPDKIYTINISQQWVDAPEYFWKGTIPVIENLGGTAFKLTTTMAGGVGYRTFGVLSTFNKPYENLARTSTDTFGKSYVYDNNSKISITYNLVWAPDCPSCRKQIRTFIGRRVQ